MQKYENWKPWELTHEAERRGIPGVKALNETELVAHLEIDDANNWRNRTYFIGLGLCVTGASLFLLLVTLPEPIFNVDRALTRIPWLIASIGILTFGLVGIIDIRIGNIRKPFKKDKDTQAVEHSESKT